MTEWERTKNGKVAIYEDDEFMGIYDTVHEYNEEKRRKEEEEEGE